MILDQSTGHTFVIAVAKILLVCSIGPMVLCFVVDNIETFLSGGINHDRDITHSQSED